MPLLIDEVIAEVANTPTPDNQAQVAPRDSGSDQSNMFAQLEILRERQQRLEVD
ncbi:hypothetical protein FE848_16985 [Marinobacter sp. 1-3A]|uniref:hypothetical protein n=1 Tax=Marinobacter sp. 1-3A TaxID=2582920 RepID=UPI0019072E5F|nr:hypothetical protein [Marinobacter sp. 1-3A]MBK1874921.1 hypothetical protein [Marinobacter sp. 1-3A]